MRRNSTKVKNEYPPAIIIGAELNGLGICRSLGKSGIPIYVIDRKRWNAAMWSKYATPILVRTLHGAEFINALTLIQRDMGGDRPVLIVTDEMALLTISEVRDQIDGLFRLHLPSHEMVVMMHDKAKFHEFAVENKLPVPEAEIFRDVSAIDRMQRLRLPVIIKPADKRFFHLKRVPRLVIAHDRETAAKAIRMMLASAGEVIVQECISGPDTDIYFSLFYCLGDKTIIFTGQKLASSPPGSGSTALCVEAPIEIQLLLDGITRAFIDLVGYAGFGGIEYKWDGISERFVIIEPTVGRTDWQEEICTLAGNNIPLRGYCYESDLPDSYEPCNDPNDANGAKPEKIIWQASYMERFKLPRSVLPRRATIIDGYWRRDDPWPALINYPVEMAWSAPKITKRMFGLGSK